MNLHRAFTLQLAVVALALAGSSQASVAGKFDRTLSVSGPVNLEVLTHSGDITVHSGPAGSVQIHGTIHANNNWLTGGSSDNEVQELERNPPVRQNGNNIRIDYADVHHTSVDYEITVPADTELRSQTGSGNQTISDLKGRIEIESGSGDLRLERLQGEMRFHTGSGNIRAEKLAGPIYARAGSGDLEFEETGSGDADIETGSGNIHLNGLAGGLNARAGSGDISVDGNPRESWRVHTGSGNVHLRLPSEAAFDVDLGTSSGTATIHHPVTTTIEGKVQQGHKTVAGKVRGGGPLLSVHTGSGDVSVD